MVPASRGSADEEFAERLRVLLNDAHANDINVEGGWSVLNDGPGRPDWDVVIVALAKPR